MEIALRILDPDFISELGGFRVDPEKAEDQTCGLGHRDGFDACCFMRKEQGQMAAAAAVRQSTCLSLTHMTRTLEHDIVYKIRHTAVTMR